MAESDSFLKSITFAAILMLIGGIVLVGAAQGHSLDALGPVWVAIISYLGGGLITTSVVGFVWDNLISRENNALIVSEGLKSTSAIIALRKAIGQRDLHAALEAWGNKWAAEVEEMRIRKIMDSHMNRGKVTSGECYITMREAVHEIADSRYVELEWDDKWKVENQFENEIQLFEDAKWVVLSTFIFNAKQNELIHDPSVSYYTEPFSALKSEPTPGHNRFLIGPDGGSDEKALKESVPKITVTVAGGGKEVGIQLQDADAKYLADHHYHQELRAKNSVKLKPGQQAQVHFHATLLFPESDSSYILYTFRDYCDTGYTAYFGAENREFKTRGTVWHASPQQSAQPSRADPGERCEVKTRQPSIPGDYIQFEWDRQAVDKKTEPIVPASTSTEPTPPSDVRRATPSAKSIELKSALPITSSRKT